VSGKKVVNRGDVYKSRSNNSINSLGSRYILYILYYKQMWKIPLMSMYSNSRTFFISFRSVDKLDITMYSGDVREGNTLFVYRSPKFPFCSTCYLFIISLIKRKINLRNEFKG
jgi:hypothetical protein